METNQTSDNTQLIAELHTALNAVTALFVSFHGFEFSCVNQALRVLEKSSKAHQLPIREILAQQIDGNNAAQQQ